MISDKIILNFENEKHKIILNDLFYMLCGIDTMNISIGLKNKKYALIISEEYSFEYLQHFEDLCINIRIINMFIKKGQLLQNSIKNIISDFFIEKMVNFFKKVLYCKNNISNVEELYVRLEQNIKEISSMRKIIDICREYNEIEIFNNLIIVQKNIDFCDELIKNCYSKIELDIVKWVTRGEISNYFFIKENNLNSLNIENCFWKHKYVIEDNQIPVNLTSDAKTILNCGKLLSLCKILKFEMKINENFLTERGLYGLFSYINSMTLTYIKDNTKQELKILQNYVLMNDMSFFNDLFIDLYNDKSFNISNDFSLASEENINFIYKINTFKKIEYLNFKICDLDLNNTLYKIFNFDLKIKNNQSIMEFLSINFSPKILSLLISRKDFLELELIFRFLFALSVIQFFLQKYFNFRFSKLVLYFIKNFKFNIYFNIKEIHVTDLELFISDLDTMIKKYLNSLFLVSSDISFILSEIIDLSFNFIGLENKNECLNICDFEIKFITIIKKLYNEIKSKNADLMFLNALENLLDKNFFLINV